jgi:hypothetical protein
MAGSEKTIFSGISIEEEEECSVFPVFIAKEQVLLLIF